MFLYFLKKLNYKKLFISSITQNKKGKSGLFITNEKKILSWIFIDHNSVNQCIQFLLKKFLKY